MKIYGSDSQLITLNISQNLLWRPSSLLRPWQFFVTHSNNNSSSRRNGDLFPTIIASNIVLLITCAYKRQGHKYILTHLGICISLSLSIITIYVYKSSSFTLLDLDRECKCWKWLSSPPLCLWCVIGLGSRILFTNNNKIHHFTTAFIELVLMPVNKEVQPVYVCTYNLYDCVK